MPRSRPFVFCRYQFLVDNEILDIKAQLSALQELQGRYLAHGLGARRSEQPDTILMRPRLAQVTGGSITKWSSGIEIDTRYCLSDPRFGELDGEPVLTWSIGQRIDGHYGVQYSHDNDRLRFVSVPEKLIRYSDFVCVPRLGAMAVDDRTGRYYTGAQGAIARLKSLFRYVKKGSVEVKMPTASDDIEKALKTWDLLEVTFEIKPQGDYAQDALGLQLSSAMRKEGIGSLRAVVKSQPGKKMRARKGLIERAMNLSKEGYGQIGVRGVMKDGHVALIPRPRFDDDLTRNRKAQAKSRYLRVYIEANEDADEEYFCNAALALMSFCGR